MAGESGMAMSPLDAAFVTEALTGVDQGCDTVNMRDGHSEFWGVNELCTKLESVNHEVDWVCINTKIMVSEDGQNTTVFKEGGEQEAWEDGYLVTKLNNINAIRMKQAVAGCHIKFGLTPNADDDSTYKHGFCVGILPDRKAVKCEKGKQTALCQYELNEEFRCQIQNGSVVVYKDDAETAFDIVGSCEEEGTSMYAKIHIRERDALGQLIQMKAIAMVTSIDISGNLLTDGGVDRLATALEIPFTKVVTLDAGLNRIKDGGAIRLAQVLECRHSKIQTLGLTHNEIADEGVSRLMEALAKEGSRVTKIFLTGNEIGDAGAMKIADCLETATCQLTIIELAWNMIADEGAQRLCQAFSHDDCKIVHFTLAHNKYIEKKTKKMLTAIMGKVTRLVDMT